VTRFQSFFLSFFSTSLNSLFLSCRVLSKKYLYDPTDIFRTITSHKREGFIKLGFYLICFFFYLYKYEAPFLSFSSFPLCHSIFRPSVRSP